MRIQNLVDLARPHRGKLALSALACFLAVFVLWLADLDKIVVQKMSSSQWSLPARVYARPLELNPGAELSPPDLERELDWLGYQASPEPTTGHYSRTDSTFRIYTRGFEFSDMSEPPRQVTLRIEDNVVETVEATTDEEPPQDYLRLEPGEIGAIHPGRHEDRILLTIAELPPGFVTALTTTEDRQFYRHFGVSLRGITRAIWINLKTGSKRQGASTLTQQLVKNLFLTSEKSWSRKITEAFMAMLMEFRYDKNTILETFINEVFIAQDGDRAIHGFGLASQYFFSRPLNELRPDQYGLLIGMLKAPSSYNPIRHPERALARRNLVLSLMHKAQLLSDTELISAQAQQLDIDDSFGHRSRANPAYLDAVKRQLVAEYDRQDLENNGIRVFTNYDPVLQHAAEQSLAETISELQLQYGPEKLPDDFLQAAVVLADPNTGEVKAIIGGRNSRYAGFNRALDAYRQVGSLLKPAIYLTAWQDPSRYTLSTLINDEPVSLAQPDGSVWEPQNFSRQHEGPIAAIQALGRSLNLASVNLGLSLGVDRVIKTLQALGIERPLPELPSLLLGAQTFSPMEMTALYQTIAADGFNAPLRTIREVIDGTNTSLRQYSIDVDHKTDLASVYLLKFALTEAMLTGTGKSAYRELPEDFYVAGKTGTTDQQRDSWFAGFSGDFLAVVWLGNDENKPMPLTGSSGALKLWTRLIKDVSRRPIDFTPPDNIEYLPVDITADKLVPDRCRSALQLPYIEDSEPAMGNRCHRSESAIGSWIRSLLSQ